MTNSPVGSALGLLSLLLISSCTVLVEEPLPVSPEPAPPPRQSFCTQQYEPVCARRGNQVRTFGNACEARSADYRILYDAPCR